MVIYWLDDIFFISGFIDRTPEGYYRKLVKREGEWHVAAPGQDSNLGPLQQGQSLCSWDTALPTELSPTEPWLDDSMKNEINCNFKHSYYSFLCHFFSLYLITKSVLFLMAWPDFHWLAKLISDQAIIISFKICCSASHHSKLRDRT